MCKKYTEMTAHLTAEKQQGKTTTTTTRATISTTTTTTTTLSHPHMKLAD